MSLPDPPIEVRLLVCPPGAEVFRTAAADGEWPCDSEWIRYSAAASLLGVAPYRVYLARRRGGVPVNHEGWISLDWVRGILRARGRIAR